MATLNEQARAQAEQDSTIETGVEVSQAIDETLIDSQREQEMLTMNHHVTTQSENLEYSMATSQKEKAISSVSQKTKADSESLAQQVKTKTPIDLANEEIIRVEAINDNKNLNTMANIRIAKCKSLLDGLKGDRKSKRDLKDKVNRAIRDMETIVDDEHVYETKRNEYKNRLGKIIYDYYTNREPARQLIMMGKRVPVINGTADTKKEAKRDNRRAKDNTEYQIDLSEIKKNTALYTLIGVSANEWGDYCDFIGQGGIAKGHPIYVQYTAGFNNIREYNPDLYRAITPEGQVTYSTYCQRNPELYQTYCQNNNIVCRHRSFNSRIGSGLADIVEYLGGNKEKDPRKRQAREKAGSVVALGGAVVLGFQLLKNLFSNKEKNPDKWKNVGIFGGSLLGLLNLDKITKRAQDITGWHPAEKTRMLAESFSTYGFSDTHAIEIANRYVGAPVATISALHFIPMYELESQRILENKNGEFEFNYENYQAYINKFAWDKDQKEQVLKAGKKLDKDKSIGAGLKAFGITTRAKFKGLFGSDKNKTLVDTDEVKKEWAKMSERVGNEVNAKLFDNGFRAVDPDAVDQIINEYEKEKNNKRINELILDWMNRGLLEFNEDKPYTMAEMQNSADIDLKKMTMKGFTTGINEVTFNSYGELFDTIYLTNQIKYKFEGVQAKSREPFKINSLGQLKFDDKNWYEFFNGDTRVISRKTFTNDFPTLKNNKDYYVAFLNKRRKESKTINIDATKYPMASKLGIYFYNNEKEIENIDNWLKKIKIDIGTHVPTDKKPPFEITVRGHLQFTAIDGSKTIIENKLSQFPTIRESSENRRKLLMFLNDKNNEMCNR